MKTVCSTPLERDEKNKKFESVPNSLLSPIEAVPNPLRSPTTPRSSVGDDAGPQSQPLWVVLCYDSFYSDFCSIVQLDPLTPEMIENPPRTKIYAKYIAHFMKPSEEPSLRWMFSHHSPTNDLYLLPGWHRAGGKKYDLHGATFNCITKTFQPIERPSSCRVDGIAVTVLNHIYFMAHPYWSADINVKYTASFDRYNPANQLWEPQEPFPRADIWRLGSNALAQAFAVWDDTILLNLGGCEIWAYNVNHRKWYHVKVHEDNPWCYDIDGEAFSVGNTIYALSFRNFNEILALSIEKNDVPGGGDIEYRCSFKSLFSVPPVEPFNFKEICSSTRSLVVLGNHNLCFVQSFEYFGLVKTQPIHVTHIKIMEDGKMVVTSQCLYRVKNVGEQFRMQFCFIPPDCKTTALKPCETFFFDPLSGTVPEVEDKFGFNFKPIHVQEKENVARPKKGCSVIIINLPPDATAEQLQRKLNKFGHLERDLIQLLRDMKGRCGAAIVKFKSRTSMRRAIKASTIRIGCRRAKIFKLRGTSFAKAM